MDDQYDPSHKTSSIASNGTVPSLYSGTSSTDYEDIFEAFESAPSIAIPIFDDDNDRLKQQSFRLETYFKAQSMLPDLQVQQPQEQEQQDQQGSQQQQQGAAPISQDTQQPRLTDDERRANHIASEQRRRNAIRNGFKELTELIPTLKNIHHSKSTILFKASEYIRHLEKRNRHLRERLGSLQLRIHRRDHHMETLANLKHQRQVALLKEQLRMQQALLERHNIAYPSSQAEVQQQEQTSPLFFMASPSVLRQSALDAPSLNIPADEEEFGAETSTMYSSNSANVSRNSRSHSNIHHHSTLNHSNAILP